MKKLSPSDLDPIETFYFYDQPLCFTAMIEGQVRLLLVADDDHDHTSWRAATPDAQTIVDMNEDRIAMRDAYTKGPFFRIDWVRGAEITIQEIDTIEPENLADEGVLLHLESEQERKAMLTLDR